MNTQTGRGGKWYKKDAVAFALDFERENISRMKIYGATSSGEHSSPDSASRVFIHIDWCDCSVSRDLLLSAALAAEFKGNQMQSDAVENEQ